MTRDSPTSHCMVVAVKINDGSENVQFYTQVRIGSPQCEQDVI